MSKDAALFRFLTICLALVMGCWQAANCDGTSPVTYIGSTAIRGLRASTGKEYVHKYLGIRYGQAPKGRMRLRPPVPEELPPVVDATRYGARCAQHPLQNTGMSEDCLFLNIYTPEPTPSHGHPLLLPVLVWIHGGDFIVGSGDMIEGDLLAAEGKVVVVTFNYRLGALGFLYTGDDSSTSNLGLWDQRLALMWVRDYIRHFGGDHERVTLGGITAGAASASIHSLSPLSRDLFRYVIQLSGSASSPWARMSPEDALHAATALGARLDCTPSSNKLSTRSLVHCIRSQRLEKLVAASTVLFPRTVALSLVHSAWGPVEDGLMVTDLNTASAFPGPLLAGLVSNEGDTLMSWTVPRLSRYIVDIEELVKHRSFYRQQFLPTLLKQAYPSHVPLSYPTRDRGQQAPYGHPPFSIVLDTMECAYLRHEQRVHHRVEAQVLTETFGDQAYVMGTLRSLRQFCTRQPSFLYFMKHQTVRPGVSGVRHTDDVAFLFGFNTTIAITQGFSNHVTATDVMLSRHFRQLVTNFITNGDPNSPTRPRHWPVWPPYTLKGADYLLLSSSPKVLSHLKAKKMALWTEELPRVLASSGNVSARRLCLSSASANASEASHICHFSCALFVGVFLLVYSSYCRPGTCSGS